MSLIQYWAHFYFYKENLRTYYTSIFLSYCYIATWATPKN